MRQDWGQLWENFMISERRKWNANSGITVNSYFWRTHQQQEIDYIEEREGILHAYEMKFSGKSAKVPAQFIQNYPDSKFTEINRDNFLDFLMNK